MEEDINIEQLRRDVIRYYQDIGSIEMDEYGTAMGFFPFAMADLIQAENKMNGQIAEVRSCDDETLKQIAEELGFNLDDYKTRGMRF